MKLENNNQVEPQKEYMNFKDHMAPNFGVNYQEGNHFNLQGKPYYYPAMMG